MVIIIRPDEPMKLVSLIGAMLEIDVTKIKKKLSTLTFTGPGITLDEKITNPDQTVEHLTIQIQIEAAAAK